MPATETLQQALQELIEERDRIDRVIDALKSGNARAARTGRRGMSPAMRREVSRRMTAYWAKRRAAKAGKPVKADRGRKNRRKAA